MKNEPDWKEAFFTLVRFPPKEPFKDIESAVKYVMSARSSQAVRSRVSNSIAGYDKNAKS